VYHLSEAGKLTAYNSKTGDIIWSRGLTKDFNAEIAEYGYTESVLVDGNNLFVRPAGQKGFQVCHNKMTGEAIWTNTEIPGTNVPL
jgi:outer membrane protein assembly factor BamB